MEDGKSERIRKVSFASEPKINYIYHDDTNSTKTSSSIYEVPMDFTTDIPEFKSMEIFKRQEDDFLNENIEDLFIGDAVQEYREDPILMKEYEKRRLSLCRRDSLDPLKAVASQAVLDTAEYGSPRGLALSGVPGIQMAEEENETNRYDKKSIDASFNDTALSNSTYDVEELVNTVDLKAMIPSVKKNKMGISEFLASIGIRFMDDSIIDGMRRDTLSKSRNEINPALYYHYKYSLKERIDYLYNFSGFLADKMNELHASISEIEGTLEPEGLNKDLLKRIRNESRNRSKIDWYNLRKLNEMQFNKNIISNKIKLAELLASKCKEEARIDSEIAERRRNLTVLRDKFNEVHKRLLENNPEELQEAEKLQQMIGDRKHLLESIRADYRIILTKADERKCQAADLESSIAKLRSEIEALKKRLLIKSITEAELSTAKQLTQRYCNMFRFKVVKLVKNSVHLSIYSNFVHLTLDDDCRVLDTSITVPTHSPFYELVHQSAQLTSLALHIRDLVGRFTFAQYIKDEVDRLKEKNRIEAFFINSLLRLRILTGVNNKIIDLTIDREFKLHYKGMPVADLREAPESLSEFIIEQINI